MATIEVGKKGLEPSTRYNLVDTDIHPEIPDWKVIPPYLSSAERRYFEIKGPADVNFLPYRFRLPSGSSRIPESMSSKGGRSGSDPELIKSTILDAFGVDAALLVNLEAAELASRGAGTEEGVILSRAFNDYFVDTWLPFDSRFRYMLAVSTQDPKAAVAEIRRHQNTPHIAAIFMRTSELPAGHRHFWPIYEVAEEVGLPVYIHAYGSETLMQGTLGNGQALENITERLVNTSCAGQFVVSSLIANGIFERFPGLKFCLAEYGFTWLLPLMWRMDNTWPMTRMEVPWIKHLPSHYVHKHIRLTTQPIEDVSDPADLVRFIQMMGDDLIMFSTDWPHFDMDRPDLLPFGGLSADAKQRVFAGNAAAFFPLDRGLPARSDV
jgi:uncharacterized protein